MKISSQPGLCAPKLIRGRHAQTICVAVILNLATFSSIVADAQGVMQQLLNERALEISSVFVVRVGARVCALPLHHVVETMRPLPIDPVVGTPAFISGVSVIRGIAPEQSLLCSSLIIHLYDNIFIMNLWG
jgi:hypothetical protein